MIIHNKFVGGNIKVVNETDTDVYVENEIRDTVGDWFYWAFCVEKAQGKTITFHFQSTRLGYFGPAVSHDLKNWRWLNEKQDDCFTYTFGADEDRVYFAHSMLYHPERFLSFAAANKLTVQEFCKSRKGRSVPCVTLGAGARSVILTSRHHACEGTGDYVLEGVLSELLADPIPDTKILCVPFMDYDGVIDGDQGKNRYPRDHGVDYLTNVPPIYPETVTMRKYLEENGCHYCFDFHAPYHTRNQNDTAFIVQNSFKKLDRLNAFGEILEQMITNSSFQYFHKNDYPFQKEWNKDDPRFLNQHVTRLEENELSFVLETAYFGTHDNIITQENMVELGKCFARAFKKYVNEKEGRIPLI